MVTYNIYFFFGQTNFLEQEDGGKGGGIADLGLRIADLKCKEFGSQDSGVKSYATAGRHRLLLQLGTRQ